MGIRVAGLRGQEFPLDQPANFYFVEADGLSLLVDAGPNPRPHISVDYVVVTHWHWDHVYGLVGLASKARSVCMSKRTLQNIDGRRALERMKTVALAVFGPQVIQEPVLDAAKSIAGRYDEVKEALANALIHEPEDCPPLTRLGAEILECPGHSDDHICIILQGHAFVGDNVVHGRSVTLTSPSAYFDSMIKLTSAAWRVAHPGHGPYELPKEVVAEYVASSLKSKLARLCRVCSAIGEEWVPLARVLGQVYPKLSRHPFIAFVAARSLLGYISDLEARGIIEVDRTRQPWMVRRASGAG